MKFTVLDGIPEVHPGDCLVTHIAHALSVIQLKLSRNDIVIICQKVVSKSENRYVELDLVEPSETAQQLAIKCEKDPRLVEVILRESVDVVRCAPGVLITRHRLGFVVANAAVDQSNLAACSRERALLLPKAPDRSAAQLRRAFSEQIGVAPAVLISDSFGRPFRVGVCGTCIGCAGMYAVQDLRGQPDRNGQLMRVTQVAVADEICAAATLLMGEVDQGFPVVICSGAPAELFRGTRRARNLIRAQNEDLFR